MSTEMRVWAVNDRCRVKHFGESKNGTIVAIVYHGTVAMVVRDGTSAETPFLVRNLSEPVDEKRRIVFDPTLWGGRDSGDNSQFWKPAIILREYRDNEGRELADVRFDHDGRVSRGHFVDGMKGEPCSR